MFRIILFFRSRLVLVYFLNGQIFLRLTSFLQTKQGLTLFKVVAKTDALEKSIATIVTVSGQAALVQFFFLPKDVMID